MRALQGRRRWRRIVFGCVTVAFIAILPELAATRGMALQGVPYTVTLAPNPVFIPAKPGASTDVTATVRTSEGQAVPNQKVVWTSNGGAGFSPQPSTTDGSGVAHVTVSDINGTAGSQTITGTAGTASGSATVDEYGAPAHLSLALHPATIPANGTSTSQAVLTITDANNVPVPSATVQMTTNGTATISPTPATNNGDGTYADTIKASRTADTETITATETTTDGSSLSTTATLVQTAAYTLLGESHGVSPWPGSYQDFETWQGSGTRLHNATSQFFLPWNFSTPSKDDDSVAGQWTNFWNQGTVPMVSWFPPMTDSVLSAGGYDTYLTGFIAKAKVWLAGPDGVLNNGDDRRAFLRVCPEANGDWNTCAPNYGDPPDAGYSHNVTNWIASWRHLHTLFANGGIDSNHLQWVFSVENKDSYRATSRPALGPPNWTPRPIAEDIYPGNAYVDWVAMDGYARATTDTPDSIFDDMLSRLEALTGDSKPIGIAEWGSYSPGGVAWKNAYIDSYFSWLQSHPIKMSVYWNASDKNNSNDIYIFAQNGSGDTTWTSQADGITYNVYSHYANDVTAGASSYLVTSDPVHNPRLITDSQFAGH